MVLECWVVCKLGVFAAAGYGVVFFVLRFGEWGDFGIGLPIGAGALGALDWGLARVPVAGRRTGLLGLRTVGPPGGRGLASIALC